jgi:hypothetical protein
MVPTEVHPIGAALVLEEVLATIRSMKSLTLSEAGSGGASVSGGGSRPGFV